jgi:hypothetical protein
MPVDLGMVGKDDPPPVRVVHFHVAPFPIYLDESQPLESGMDLLTGQQG